MINENTDNVLFASQPLPVSGEAMDIPVAKTRTRWWLFATAGAFIVAALGIWYWTSDGLRVSSNDLRIASVERRAFQDDIIVRSTVQPLKSIFLDAVDRGRVEHVYVRDGAMVKEGDLLFRLSNPQLRMELLQRQSEQAQQISNLATFDVNFEAARYDSLRRLNDLAIAVRDAEKVCARQEQLAEKGFVSQATLKDSVDRLQDLRVQLRDEQAREAQATSTRSNAMKQLQIAITGMRSGLELVTESIDALSVRAPIGGRLTDFKLQEGESVRVDQRIGRIDQPAAFKLTSQIDEFYLRRVSVGQHGRATLGGKTYPVMVQAIFPQVKDGRFSADFVFLDDKPTDLNPGTTIDLTIALGEASPALILPSGPYLNDTAGAWVFAVAAGGSRAERRAVRIGRRSNTQVEILSGLKPGERVIVSTYATFGNSKRLRLTN